MMRTAIKKLINGLFVVLVSPCALPCYIESRISSDTEYSFSLFSHFFALFPGMLGVLARRAYYYLTTTQCSLNCVIGFGTIFTHKNCIIHDHVSLGNYCIIGSVEIGKGCEIASRVSITSGKRQHTLMEDGTWSPFSSSNAQTIRIGKNVWIGEGAIIMANVQEKSLVGAGSVVGKNVMSGTIVTGNPAIKIGSL